MDCRAKFLCPPGSPRVCSDSYPLSQWCYLTISFSAALFFCLQSFPASESFPVSLLFSSGGQSNGASASTWVFPTNIQGWFPLGLTGLISLHPKGLSRVFSSTTVQNHQLLGIQPCLWSNSTSYMTPGKSIVLIIQTFVGKVMCLCFLTYLSRFVISCSFKEQVFFSFVAAVTVLSDFCGPKKRKSVTTFTFPRGCNPCF